MLRTNVGARFAAAALLVAALSGAREASAQNAYLALEPGDQALFATSVGGTAGQVTSNVTRTSGHWREYRDFAGFGLTWLWPSETTNRAWVWTSRGGVQYLGDFDVVGSSASVELGGVRGTVTVGATGETVSVPAGTFDGCVRLDLAGFGASKPERAWLKASVGVVRWEGRSSEGVLASGTIGGTTYPRPLAGTRLTVICPEWAFANMMPGPGGPRPAPTIQVSAQIANDSTEPVRLVYQAGRPTIRVDIVDAQGTVRTSQAPRIRAALVPFDLQPGESSSAALLEVTLVDDAAGLPSSPVLPAGDYTIRIRFADRYEQLVPFNMSWAF